MEKERVVEGDERTLVLFLAWLNQGMTAEDYFHFNRIDNKEDFLRRNNLSDKLENKAVLEKEIRRQIEKLAEENMETV